jgi:hypothetical protein
MEQMLRNKKGKKGSISNRENAIKGLNEEKAFPIEVAHATPNDRSAVK